MRHHTMTHAHTSLCPFCIWLIHSFHSMVRSRFFFLSLVLICICVFSPICYDQSPTGLHFAFIFCICSISLSVCVFVLVALYTLVQWTSSDNMYNNWMLDLFRLQFNVSPLLFENLSLYIFFLLLPVVSLGC